MSLQWPPSPYIMWLLTTSRLVSYTQLLAHSVPATQAPPCFSWIILSQLPPQDFALDISSVWIPPSGCPNLPYINSNTPPPTYSAHHSYHPNSALIFHVALIA